MPDTASVYVIYNPTAGRGQTARRVEALRGKLGERGRFVATQGPGHAETLARDAVASGYLNIGAAGGDGIVHETMNGVLAAGRAEAVLTVFPFGSANDFAHTMAQRDAWRSSSEETWQSPRPVDVGRVTTAAGRQRYFINGFGLGFNCVVTREARRIRFLRGIPLYTTALVRAMTNYFDAPDMTLTIDGAGRQSPTLSLTVLLGRREGNFKLAPQAVLDDEQFDYLHVGSISRGRLLRYVPRMIGGRIPTQDPAITSGRCRSIEITGPEPLSAHLDGEFFCLPDDDVRNLKVELLAGALLVALGP